MILIWSLVLFFIIFTLLAIALYFLIYKKYRALKLDLAKIIIAIKRVRYGDINVRIEKLENKTLEKAINRLIETISDREMMIKEYQATLSRKNLSLEEILKQEKQLQQFKEEFAATLTHDMKVPVVAELNSINFLLEGRFGELNKKQTEILSLMKASNQELKDLIENMLETYRLDTKKLELKYTNIDINDFIKNIVNEMNPIALKNNHKLNLNIEDTKSIQTNIDDFQIKRVIKNLIQNAISFSPSSTDINIKTKKDDFTLKIFVSNKGQGISTEELDLIFHKYYSGSSKFRKAGTGLGLYLSQQIVLAHNGELRVDCNKKDETTFILSLPL